MTRLMISDQPGRALGWSLLVRTASAKALGWERAWLLGGPDTSA